MAVVGSKGTVEGVYGALQPLLGVLGSPTAGFMVDAYRPQLWYQELGQHSSSSSSTATLLGRDLVDYSLLNRKLVSTAKALAITVDSLRGDVYSLESSSFGNISIRKNGSVFKIKSDTIDPVLFLSRDIKIDAIRNSLWIADSGNHRVLQVDNEGVILEEYTDNDFLFPITLAFNANTGDFFARAYNANGLTERIFKLSDGAVTDLYASPGFFGWLDFADPNSDGNLLVLEDQYCGGLF